MAVRGGERRAAAGELEGRRVGGLGGAWLICSCCSVRATLASAEAGGGNRRQWVSTWACGQMDGWPEEI